MLPEPILYRRRQYGKSCWRSLKDYKSPADMLGQDGFLKELTKALVEKALAKNIALRNPALNQRGINFSVLQRQVDATDREIDQLVYELYGLTEDEIKIIEASTTK